MGTKYTSVDGLEFTCEEEKQAYEYKYLQRKKYPLNLQEAFTYFVRNDAELERVKEMELPSERHTISVLVHNYPCHVLSFDDAENEMLHIVPLDECKKYLCNYICQINCNLEE